MSYTGNKPEFSVLDVETFPTNGVLTSFTLKYKAGGPNAIDVYINNVWQEPFEAYGLVGKELSFDEAPPTGELVVRYKAIEGVTQYGKTVSDEANPNTIVERRSDGSIAATSSTENGSVLVKGDYGIGGNVVPLVGSIDSTDIPNGLYLVGPSNAGRSKPYTFGYLQVIGEGTSGIKHIIHSVSNPESYCSQYISGSGWTAWGKNFNSFNILGTVSQSGGTPTGAIIQRGSNANGEFTRFADGTLRVWAALTSTGNILTWSFPSIFISGTVICSGNSGGNAGNNCLVSFSPPSPTAVGVALLNAHLNSYANAGIPFGGIADGRWF
jgi:hypothetical protein